MPHRTCTTLMTLQSSNHLLMHTRLPCCCCWTSRPCKEGSALHESVQGTVYWRATGCDSHSLRAVCCRQQCVVPSLAPLHSPPLTSHPLNVTIQHLTGHLQEPHGNGLVTCNTQQTRTSDFVPSIAYSLTHSQGTTCPVPLSCLPPIITNTVYPLHMPCTSLCRDAGVHDSTLNMQETKLQEHAATAIEPPPAQPSS